MGIGGARTCSIDSTAGPERIWALIARPDRWSLWSPHVRGAEGLGWPEVQERARGSVLLRGGARLGAEITGVAPGRSWSWRVGGLEIDHLVEPTERGSRLTFVVEPTRALWAPAAVAYTPIVGRVARRIARLAEVETD